MSKQNEKKNAGKNRGPKGKNQGNRNNRGPHRNPPPPNALKVDLAKGLRIMWIKGRASVEVEVGGSWSRLDDAAAKPIVQSSFKEQEKKVAALMNNSADIGKLLGMVLSDPRKAGQALRALEGQGTPRSESKPAAKKSDGKPTKSADKTDKRAKDYVDAVFSGEKPPKEPAKQAPRVDIAKASVGATIGDAIKAKAKDAKPAGPLSAKQLRMYLSGLSADNFSEKTKTYSAELKKQLAEELGIEVDDQGNPVVAETPETAAEETAATENTEEEATAS